jgi:hypothetical protein
MQTHYWAVLYAEDIIASLSHMDSNKNSNIALSPSYHQLITHRAIVDNCYFGFF